MYKMANWYIADPTSGESGSSNDSYISRALCKGAVAMFMLSCSLYSPSPVWKYMYLECTMLYVVVWNYCTYDAFNVIREKDKIERREKENKV